MKHALFTGGGTAGHVMPTLPVIDTLAQRGVDISYIGSTTGLELTLLGNRNVRYFGIATGKLRRYISLENLKDAGRVLRGIAQSFRILGEIRPDVVFSKGGFVSFPVVFAAWLRQIPVVAHESDFSPGLANRLASPFVSLLCTSFESTALGRFSGRVRYAGSPIRPSLLLGDAERGRQWLGFGDARPLLLVTGGSLGAEVLNTVVRDALPELIQRFNVVHLCGAGNLIEKQMAGYRQFEFLDAPWGDVLAAADIVVSRAGANTLSELLALHKPNLLVPLSRRVSRGDQIENAAYAQSAGYSLVLAEEALDATTLVESLDRLSQGLGEYQRRLASYQPPDAVTTLILAMEEVAISRW